MTTNEKGFFVGLRPGKKTGLCESLGGSADNGSVVEIHSDCPSCTVMQCMMFLSILDETGATIGKRFTPHDPQY